MKWTADIMTDPMRDHKLHVELKEDGNFRARIYRDESGQVQLRVYDGPGSIIPVEWLLGIIQRFSRENAMQSPKLSLRRKSVRAN
jgi:hypothetical protein